MSDQFEEQPAPPEQGLTRKAPLPPAPSAAPARVKCPSCFNYFTADKKFCPKCGRSREELARYTEARREQAEVSRETRRTWEGLKQMSTFYVLLLSFNFVGAYVLPLDKPWGLLALDGVIVILSIAWLCSTRISIAQRFRLGKFPIFVLLLLPLASCITVAIAHIDNWLFISLFGLQKYFDNIRGVERMFQAKMPLWVLIVSIAVIPGIFEEIFFRGLVQSVLESTLRKKEAWIVQAVIFAIAHLNPLGFFTYLLLMGLWLGWLRNRSGSLIPGMIAHFSHNLIVVLADHYHWLG